MMKISEGPRIAIQGQKSKNFAENNNFTTSKVVTSAAVEMSIKYSKNELVHIIIIPYQYNNVISSKLL